MQGEMINADVLPCIPNSVHQWRFHTPSRRSAAASQNFPSQRKKDSRDCDWPKDGVSLFGGDKVGAFAGLQREWRRGVGGTLA